MTKQLTNAVFLGCSDAIRRSCIDEAREGYLSW